MRLTIRELDRLQSVDIGAVDRPCAERGERGAHVPCPKRPRVLL